MIKPTPFIPTRKAPLFERLLQSGATREPQESIRSVSLKQRIVQDFRPVVQSLEWQLSELYWANNGVGPFVRSEVPFIINNNGRASEDAALVLFANCNENPGRGPINVLELGAGTGLFARFFLNAFRTMCKQENRDFYDRLTYFVSDRAQRTCEQWKECQLFGDHADHVVVGICSGEEPTLFQTPQMDPINLPSLRAVFANYVLDVMPSTIVRAGSKGAEQLCIRTHLTNNHELIPQYSDLSLSQVQQLATAESAAELAKLLPILSVFEFETKFLPVGEDKPPYLIELLEFAENDERNVLNFGAIRFLEQCLTTVDKEGFILLSDYGPTERDQIAGHAATQRFGSSLALGINFPFLEFYLSKQEKIWLRPDDNKRGIHARMICHAELPHTRDAFLKRYSNDAQKYFDSPLEEAVHHAAAGRNDQALESYRLALERSPRDWHLIGQAAEFVSLQLKNFEAGMELTCAALAFNPCYSTWLWNILGDCLFCMERFTEAHEAYLQAKAINADDPRTNFNLSYTLCQTGRYQEALLAIAHGLATDAQGLYRERLLNKQQQVLSLVAARDMNERDRLLKRAAAFS